jgi:hypothetical protein
MLTWHESHIDFSFITDFAHLLVDLGRLESLGSHERHFKLKQMSIVKLPSHDSISFLVLLLFYQQSLPLLFINFSLQIVFLDSLNAMQSFHDVVLE